MGMIDESIETASVLGHNYPNSIWYKYSYELIKLENDDKSIIEKLKKIF